MRAIKRDVDGFGFCAGRFSSDELFLPMVAS
jgi:hypothetical protein